MTDKAHAARLIAELAREHGQDPKSFVEDFRRKLGRHRLSADFKRRAKQTTSGRHAA